MKGSTALLANPGVNVTCHPRMFRDERITGVLPPGMSIDEIIGQMVVSHAIHPVIIPSLRVSVWNERTQRETSVPFKRWKHVKPKAGCSVRVVAVPMGGGGGGGGKSPIKMIAMLAIAVVAWQAAPVLAGMLPGAMAAGPMITGAAGYMTTFGAIASFAIGGAITLVGNALINAIIPTNSAADRSDSLTSSSLSTPTYSIMGVRNRANPFGVVPKIYGKRRAFPMLGANTYTETQGDDQYFRALFCFGYGPLLIEQIKIGDTSIDEFTDVEYEVRQGYDTDTPLTLFTKSVHENTLNVALTQAGGWAVRTTAANTDEITVDINLPRGLTKFESSNSRSERSVSLSVEYSPTGAGTWTSAGTIDITDNSTSAVLGTLRWTVTNGQYDVRIQRTTADSTDDTIVDKTYWSALRSITSDYPINMTGLALLAIRIKATEQLNGSIENLNAVCTSILPTWNGSAWQTPSATRNPAWAFCDVLRGPANNRPTDDADIDIDAIYEWAQACDATSPQGEGPMWKYDAVHDKASTVEQTLREIAASARARYIRRDGKESILRDVAQTTPWQHFTPRNSFGFKSVKTFVDHPHGLKCRFVNPDQGWQEDEVIAYSDGYSSANASLFEQIDMLACTSDKQAWREGRYQMAVAKLRPATYELQTDVENLACQPGDLIYVAYDVPQWGQWQSRIRSMTSDGGGNILTITFDSTVTMAADRTYVVRIRRAYDNTSLYAAVNTVAGETATLTFSPPVSPAEAPALGDIAMFGETGEESVRCIVKSVIRGQDLSAKIIFVDEAPAVHTSYTGTIPAFTSNISQVAAVEQQTPPIPVIREVWDDEVVSGNAVVSRTYIGLTVPTSATVPAVGVDAQYRPVGAPNWSVVPVTILGQDIGIDGLADGQQYDIRVRSVSKYGVPSSWASAVYTPVGLSRPPEDVTGFSITVLDTTAYLSWLPVGDPDISHYVIKWSEATSGATWASSQILVPRVDGTSITVPALVGTYLIKAVDTSTSESVNETLVTNGVSGVLNLNQIATITEDPTFAGTKSDVEVKSGALELASTGLLDDIADIDAISNWDVLGGQLAMSGIYYFDSDLDLGSIFTSRLTASVSVSGVNYASIVDEWTDVDALTNWDGADPTNWNIELQVRTSDDYSTWGAWQTFVIGDYSARAFQWRVIMESSAVGVTPSITALSVSVDMPDRLASDNDVTCGTGGLTVTFSPSFRATPAIATVDQNMATGDYKVIASKSASGFTIQYFNSVGTPVSRTFDWVARGYGYVT